MKIKYHICKTCGTKVECDADVCFVPDDSCGKEACLKVKVLATQS